MEEVTFVAVVRKNGRIVIPTEIRRFFKIDERDLVQCRIKKISK